jgi:hypothetical protein
MDNINSNNNNKDISHNSNNDAISFATAAMTRAKW